MPEINWLVGRKENEAFKTLAMARRFTQFAKEVAVL